MPSRKTLGCLLIMLTLSAVLTGCGRTKKAVHSSVKGTVTWNGKPLQEGSIVFVLPSPNKDTHEGRVTSTIKEGSYSMAANQGPYVGSNKVQIVAVRKTGKKATINERPTDAEGAPSYDRSAKRQIEISEQYLPRNFNESSTLTADVRPGANEFDFQLTGKEIAIQIAPE